MIDRYRDDEITRIWGKFSWVALMEMVSAEVLNKRGVDPKVVTEVLRTHTTPDQVAGEEANTKHEVTAFLKAWTRNMSDDAKREVHLGMTSSDLVDTVGALQLRKTFDHLDRLLTTLRDAVKEFAVKEWKTVRIGRTHGQWAEPATVGYRFGGFVQRLRDIQREIAFLYPRLCVMKLSGAVGTYPLGYDLQKAVARGLGLQYQAFSTQCVARDARASYLALLAQVAGVVEELSLEVRHSSRPEIAEIFESFTDGQTGSSAMPHKQNPVTSENLTGLARLQRGYLGPMLESMALLHERDISHSSVERVAMVDAFHCAATLMDRAAQLVKGLRVDRERCERNLDSTHGLWATGAILTYLVREEGFTREDAYSLVQEAASLVGSTTNLETGLWLAFKGHNLDFPDSMDTALGVSVWDLDHRQLFAGIEPARRALESW